MNGPAMMMAAPAVHRSHSSPDLFLDPSPLTTSTPPLSTPADDLGTPPASAKTSRERSGSTGIDVPAFDFGSGIETSLLFESRLTPKVDVAPNGESAPSSLPIPPEPMAVPRAPPTKRRSRSIVDRPKSWLTSKSASTDGSDRKDKAVTPRKDKRAPDSKEEKESGKAQTTPERKVLTAADRSSSSRSASFADFARKSWKTSSRSPSTSRSPSPKGSREKKEVRQEGEDTDAGGSPKKESSLLTPHKLTRRRPTSNSVGEGDKNRPGEESRSGTSRALNRASVYFGKIKTQKAPNTEPLKPSASLAVPSQGSTPKSEDVSPAPSTRSVSDNHNHRLSSQTNVSANSDTSSGGTGSTGITEPLQVSENVSSQKPQAVRDPLWATFRRLDSEYAIFLTKTTTSQRVLVARNTLIPFFRAPSPGRDGSALSPEDIDRRATIINKWWNGLLELLEGTGSNKGSGGPATTFNAIQVNQTGASLQPVSGVDRPGLLELITMIMMRPEWRMCTPYFRPLKDRSSEEVMRGRARARDSTSFIPESAEHNVRNTFVKNLLTQMAIVVDKMSSRHAPASLVTFCGKACAYAFFFVPGIAEVLVRLWGLTPDLLRRVADELHLPRRSKGESDDIVALFPPNLHKLGWTSVKAMTDNLRLTTKLSLVAAKIPWHGAWVSRWRGADSDLFFIFCKYYYILAEDFMPMGLPLVEKARAPGFALVNAQLLSVLDTTIHHRQAAFENMNMLDPANGADAMATALAQLPPSNLLRGMDENRLIVLLKDILAENSIGGLAPGARDTFATAFMSILKAATKKTPVFRQTPVLMLMEFLHEVLLVFDAYTGYTDPEYKSRQRPDHVDWQFWFEVFHKVLFESNSTMSEIRILSFVFSAWDVLTADPVRKEKLCIGWLLSEEVFDKFFNNYTPMVRAYFMRLLCWRVCRDEGSPNELDMRIFSLVSDRLRQAWSHYLWLKQVAETNRKLPPSTAPCHPQPGKRFMIIRTETTPPQTGLLQTGFDTMTTTAFGAHEVSAAASGPSESGGDSPTLPGEPSSKRKWSLFGKMLSFTSTTSQGGSASAEGSGRGSGSKDDLEAVRRATAASRSGPPPPPKGSSPSSGESDASSTGSSPVFDAARYVFKFTLGALPWNPNTDMSDAATALLSTLPRERPLSRPRLPAPAQARVSARANSTGAREDSLPPPSPGLPAPERMYSGTSQGGLINEARNAAPQELNTAATGREGHGVPDLVLSLPEIQRVASIESKKDVLMASPVSDDSDRLEIPRGRTEVPDYHAARPMQPMGFFRDRATYSGRALAEWAIVVHECNSFIDRRRDEGVCGLKEVEVPSLGVENLRRMG